MYNKPKSKIRLTNLGKWLLFLAFFLLFSAQNTGNNLLYLVCSCIFTAICFGLTNVWFSCHSFKAEIIYPKTVQLGQNFDLVCKIAKNSILTRYYIRFEDSWLEVLKRGQNGYLSKTFCFDRPGKYIFKNFTILKPGMLEIFYCYYTFPDFVIYVDDFSDTFEQDNTKLKEKNKVSIKSLGREGDFYSLKAYKDGEDASLINWVVSAKSSEEWVVLREKEDEEKKNTAYSDKVINNKIYTPKLDNLECFTIQGKDYKEIFGEGLKKDLNSFVYRIMILLALLTCFGVYNTGFLQGLTSVLAVFFVIFGIRGKSLNKPYHNFIHILCVGVGLYILLKAYSPNSPPRIVLLLEFSVLTLALQYLTMTNIRSLLGALTLVFMIILGIAAMNINSAYPAIFLPFLIFTSMILTFFRVNLVSSESNIKNSYAINPRGIGGTIALLIIFTFLWIPFFYLIPRTNSYGIASDLSERRNKGFNSTSMSLNNSGLLEDNLTVVMRIIPNDEKTISPAIIRRLSKKLIRGGSFLDYENGEWKKRRRGMWVKDLRSTSGELVLDRNYYNFKNLHSMDVVIENSDTTAVFVPYGTKVIDYRYGFIGMEIDGSMFFVDRRTNNNKRYGISLLPDELEFEDTTEEELEKFEYDFRVGPYFSLNGTTDKIQYLANTMMAKTESVKERAELIMKYLNTNCSYSLEQPELIPGEDPVESFLFNKMPGTCQHYSTAMVLLLRCMGIPSRVANGYMMSEWNETGGFFTVRQSHAHAWVEVYFPKSGWIPFDPTPSDTSYEPTKLKQLWDKLVEIYEGYWFNYVYSFDKNAQNIAKRNYLSVIFKKIGQVLSSPYFTGFLFIVLFSLFLFRRYIEVSYRYYSDKSRWVPFSYVLWENETDYLRRDDETPSEYHKRLYLDKKIDDEGRKKLSEVEELIDEYAFRSGADKTGISKRIKHLLSKVKLL